MRTIFVIFFLLFFKLAIGQVKFNTADDFKNFIPENYAILDIIIGDLNLDNVSDAIMILKKNGEERLSDVIENPEKRPLIILLRDANNELQLVRRNDNTVYCYDCGGVFGEPYQAVSIYNGHFSVEHYGGSSWRWTRKITYNYSKKDNEWYLYEDSSVSFHASEPEKVESKTKTAKDFGKVRFEAFDIYNEE
jgi:hypothetical protein